MESEDKLPGKDGSGKAKDEAGKARGRKDPVPPLQPDGPAEEGAPVAAQGAAGMKGLRVADIMIVDPVCCLPGTPIVKVARLMAENSCGAIPVIRSAEDRTPAGMVTDRDVAMRTLALGKNPLDMTAGDVMSPPPPAVAPDDPVQACAGLMRGRKLRRVLVLDSAGRVCGLVAEAQMARHLPESPGGLAEAPPRPPSPS